MLRLSRLTAGYCSSRLFTASVLMNKVAAEAGKTGIKVRVAFSNFNVNFLLYDS